MEVSLNSYEQNVAKAVARRKTDNSMAANLNSTWSRGPEPYQPDIEGYGAEVAFCKLFNLFVDMSWNNKRGGFDCKLPDGTTVDVKWTSRWQHELYVKAGNKRFNDSEVYALMAGRFPDYMFIGWATREEVFAAPIIQATYAKNYTIYEDQLHKADELTKYGVIHGTI